MKHYRIIQLDSVPVIMRTQYMPAFSRYGPYDPALHDRVAYTDDAWFEVWAHEASLVPVETEPLLRWSKARAEAGATWKGLARLASEEPGYIDDCYNEIAERGPLAPSELTNPRPREGEWWGSRSVGSLALDWLFRTGRVGIRRRGNFEKVFDVIENIVPATIRAIPTPDESDAVKQLLVDSCEALGVGTANCLVDYFRLPPRLAKPLLPELVEDGRLIACSVDGWDRDAFMAPNASIPRAVHARALLSPFDPVVWNRERGERLFDFHYRIEIYVPKHKRKWGYYVLPFLLGNRLVGRVDVKNDRAERTLLVPAAHIEPAEDETDVAEALADELWQLAAFVGADEVKVGRKGNLASALRSTIRR